MRSSGCRCGSGYPEVVGDGKGRVSPASAVDLGNDGYAAAGPVKRNVMSIAANESTGADGHRPENPELFISYASGDIDQTAALHGHLTAQGFVFGSITPPDARLRLAQGD